MNKKRITTLFSIIIIILVTVSCSPDEEIVEKSIIKKAELTDREESFIKGTGINHSFIFEYQENNDVKNIDVWIEGYLGGEKIGPLLKTSNKVKDDSEKYIMFNISNIQDKNTWSISFIEGKNISTGKIDSRNDLGKTSTWDMVESIEVDDGEYILAALVGNDGNTINGIPNGFFSQPEEYMREVLSNDYVYLLKIKLY